MSYEFEFCCPTKIVCGAHSLEKLADELISQKISHPVVVSDAGLVRLGVAAKLTNILDEQGVRYELFDAVPPDSSLDTVNELATLYKNTNADGFIAIGGGSVIDTTKGAAGSLACEGKDFATLQGSEIITADLPPLIVAPTTAGTGSEVTLVAVVADTHAHAKLSFTSYKLVPHVAILDPSLTESLPPKLTSTTGIDALTHAIEAYTSTQKNPVSDALACAGISLICQNLPTACKEGGNKDARLNLALGSLLAGAAFSNAMVGIVHAIGHSLGGLCHIAHGQAMMLLLPHCVAYNIEHGIHLKEYAELYNILLEAMNLNAMNMDEEEITRLYTPDNLGLSGLAKAFNELLFAMNRFYHDEYGVAIRLADLGVDTADLPAVAEQARYDGAALYNSVEITMQAATDILKAAY